MKRIHITLVSLLLIFACFGSASAATYFFNDLHNQGFYWGDEFSATWIPEQGGWTHYYDGWDDYNLNPLFTGTIGSSTGIIDRRKG